MLPNFIIIGAPRAGTTWLAANLREHPEIFMPPVKELHFFDAEYEKGIPHYERWFNQASGEPAVGEATPSYLYLPFVAERIAAHLPDIKLIACLRDPVERLYSRYWNAKAKYPENTDLTFEQKLEKKPLFIHEGLYADHLERYFRLFPRENILITFYEDLKDNPGGYLRNIYRYLSVDEGFESPLLKQTVNSAASKNKISKSKALWHLYQGLMKIRAFGLAEYVHRANMIPYPPMRQETRRWLVEDVYAESNRRLSDLVGRDLSHWSRL